MKTLTIDNLGRIFVTGIFAVMLSFGIMGTALASDHEPVVDCTDDPVAGGVALQAAIDNSSGLVDGTITVKGRCVGNFLADRFFLVISPELPPIPVTSVANPLTITSFDPYENAILDGDNNPGVGPVLSAFSLCFDLLGQTVDCPFPDLILERLIITGGNATDFIIATAGISATFTNLTLDKCIVTDNHSTPIDIGAGLTLGFGGMSIFGGTLEMYESVVSYNSVTTVGSNGTSGGTGGFSLVTTIPSTSIIKDSFVIGNHITITATPTASAETEEFADVSGTAGFGASGDPNPLTSGEPFVGLMMDKTLVAGNSIKITATAAPDLVLNGVLAVGGFATADDAGRYQAEITNSWIIGNSAHTTANAGFANTVAVGGFFSGTQGTLTNTDVIFNLADVEGVGDKVLATAGIYSSLSVVATIAEDLSLTMVDSLVFLNFAKAIGGFAVGGISNVFLAPDIPHTVELKAGSLVKLNFADGSNDDTTTGGVHDFLANPGDGITIDASSKVKRNKPNDCNFEDEGCLEGK